jgi:tetratricopeptide (TPR) repeat protein
MIFLSGPQGERGAQRTHITPGIELRSWAATALVFTWIVACAKGAQAQSSTVHRTPRSPASASSGATPIALPSPLPSTPLSPIVSNLDTALAAAQSAIEAHNHATASAWLQAVLDKSPDHPRALLLLAALYRDQHRADAALQVALRLRQVASNQAATWKLLSLLHLEAGDAASAQLDARRVTELAPDAAEGYTLRGLALLEQARQALRKASSAQGEGALTAPEYLAQARAQLEIASSIDRSDRVAWLALARALALQEHSGQARAALNQALAANPKDPQVHCAIASFDLEIGDLSGARAATQRALELSPTDLQAKVLLAQVCYREDDTAQASQLTHEILLRQPDCAAALVLRGSMLRDQGQWAAARNDLENAVVLLADDPAAHAALGTLYLIEGSPEAACEQLTQAVSLGLHDSATRNNLGLALKQLARYPEAINQLEKSLYLDPTQADVHYNLAVAKDLGGDRQQASQHYARYLELVPEAPEAPEIRERLKELAGH